MVERKIDNQNRPLKTCKPFIFISKLTSTSFCFKLKFAKTMKSYRLKNLYTLIEMNKT